MRFFTPLFVYVIFLFNLSTPQSVLALQTFKLTPNNFASTLNDITTNYSYLFKDDSIPDSLEVYLQNKLFAAQIHPECGAPLPRIKGNDLGGLTFSWEKGAYSNQHMISYFKLADGTSEAYATSNSEITIFLPQYDYTLFAFANQCDRFQGHVNLIIVERDIFSLQGPSGGDQASNPALRSILQAFPNPFQQQLTLSYQLEQAQPLSIEIRSVDGRLMLPVIDKGMMSEGLHEEVIELSHLPGGLYFCRLIGDRVESIPLLKKE